MKGRNTRLGFVGKAKDLVYLGSYVTINNNNSVMVENCSRICECSDIMVKVSAGDYYVQIWGNELKMWDYSQNVVMIDGEIDSVKLISKDFAERRVK